MKEETQQYIESWTKKLARHSGDELHDIFETFSGQYNIYARLADDISHLLLADGKIKKRGEDKNAVTTNILLFAVPDEIAQALRENNNDVDITHVLTLMEQGIFHIKFNKLGEYQRDVDLRLVEDIKSDDLGKKMLAILEVIYYVRCNKEHQRKHFDEYQRLLLEPLINILQTLNSFVSVKLGI